MLANFQPTSLCFILLFLRRRQNLKKMHKIKFAQLKVLKWKKNT